MTIVDKMNRDKITRVANSGSVNHRVMLLDNGYWLLDSFRATDGILLPVISGYVFNSQNPDEMKELRLHMREMADLRTWKKTNDQ